MVSDTSDNKHIFISYARRDATEESKKLQKELEAHGFDIWRDDRINPSNDFTSELGTAIREAKCVVVLITEDIKRSDSFVRREITYAMNRDIPIFVLLFPGGEKPIHIANHTHIDFSDWGSGLDTLLKWLNGEYDKTTRHTISNKLPAGLPLLFILGSLLVVIIVGIMTLLPVRFNVFQLFQEPDPPAVAYLFMLDTSDAMNETLNGRPRYDIARQAIRNIVDDPGATSSRVWRGLRIAGGGDEDVCNQTELLLSGRDVMPNQFKESLNLVPAGNNAYNAGINATFDDIGSVETERRIVFLLLGSLDTAGCGEVPWQDILRWYQSQDIDSVVCAFTILEDDDPLYADLQEWAVAENIPCFYQVERAQQISDIGIGIIQAALNGEPLRLPTLTPTPTSTSTPTSTPTPTPTPTLPPAPTESGGRTAACRFTLTENIDAELHPELQDDGIDPVVTLQVNETIQILGIRANRASWILQRADLLGITQTLYYPFGEIPVNGDISRCEPSFWGVPAGSLRDLTGADGVLAQMGLNAWGDYDGSGVRIALLDADLTGFEAYRETVPDISFERLTVTSDNDNATSLRTSQRGNNTFSHGVNMLKVLTEIASGADYVVIETTSISDVANASSLLVKRNSDTSPDNDVDMVIHASNIITPADNPLLPDYYSAIRSAREAGMLWINSAGSVGSGYYRFQFVPESLEALGIVHDFADFTRDSIRELSLMVPIYEQIGTDIVLVWDVNDNPNGRNDFGFLLNAHPNTGVLLQPRPGQPDRFNIDDNQRTSDAAYVPGIEQVTISGETIQRIPDIIAIPDENYQGLTYLNQPLADETRRRSADGISDNELYIFVEDSGSTGVEESRRGIWLELYVDNALPAKYDPHIKQSLAPVVLAPADSADALVVGAFAPIFSRTYDPANPSPAPAFGMAWYSGRFNQHQYQQVNQAYIKPDVTAYGDLRMPDGHEFRGTSASTALTGGVAALVMQWQRDTTGASDSETTRRILSQQAVVCLADGAVGQQLDRLQLPAPDAMNTLSDVQCDADPTSAGFDTSQVTADIDLGQPR